MGTIALVADEEVYRGLTYPWSRKAGPPIGEPVEVAPGIHWVRFPLPMALDHINLWLIEEDDGFTVVDTGLSTERSRTVWEPVLRDYMGGKPIRRVICTHFHADHMGLAGWLIQRFDCELWMSRGEFLMCRAMASDTGRPAPDVAIRFYAAAGYDEAAMDVYRAKFGRFGEFVAPVPDCFRRLIHGQSLRIGGRRWQAVGGGGHSPEHICLYCPELKVLISGDQVLPRISPNVSVHPTEPHADPLREFLEAQGRLCADLPADLLVLPSHGAPFRGLHVRLKALILEHQRSLGDLLEYLDEPKRAVDCFSVLFKREITLNEYGLATGETLAHLHCLLGQGRVTKERDADGIDWYRRVSMTGELGG